ncbi:MAG: SAM-dependent methyltransferase [Clostridiales bacterium]|nr:SAM-dependent methyltransferase [Clostridiales bacterium]
MTRLDALESVIVPAETIADVGCDHGLVAKYCVTAGLAELVIASDISEACLDKARHTLADEKNVQFVRCDGIGYSCDEAVISGMGGLLICGILDRANADGLLPTTLVLLPHRDADAVRRKLTELKYGIDKDFMIKDRGRYYSVIRAERRGAAQSLTERQYLFGAFCEVKSDVLVEYLTEKYKIYLVAPERNADKLSKLRDCLSLQGADVGGDI